MIIGIGIIAAAAFTISMQPNQNIGSRQQISFKQSQPTPAIAVKRVTPPQPPADTPPPTPPLPKEPLTVIETPPAPPQPVYHTVQKGETLYSIADHHYSDPSKWKKIKAANKNIPEQNTLRPNMRLLIPMD